MLVLIIGIGALYFSAPYLNHFYLRLQSLRNDGLFPSGSVRGIDISHHQGDIDWAKLNEAEINNSPIAFVIMKATEGGNMIDDQFYHNFEEARKYHIIRGAYHFFNTNTDPKVQADFFCHVVQLEDDDLIPVLDVETKGPFVTKRQLRESVLTWLNTVEKHYGVKPMIYASYKFKETYLDGPAFSEYPYWIAHYYVDTLQYRGPWNFWQHTDVGSVDGIQEYVDVDVFNGDFEDLLDMTIEERR